VEMVGKYRLTKTLGQGSYGRVKRMSPSYISLSCLTSILVLFIVAIDDDTRRKYAVKIIEKVHLTDKL
jgi:hypothetical protein